MGKHRLLARRRRGSTRAIDIAVLTAGLFVGIGAWNMSHPARPAVPTVTWVTAADTPVPTAAPTPTAHRTGFVLTP